MYHFINKSIMRLNTKHNRGHKNIKIIVLFWNLLVAIITNVL